MNSKKSVDEFFQQKTLAMVGVSRDTKKFGYQVYRELKSKGYHLLAVNPQAQQIDGEPCYPNLRQLPEKAGGVIVMTPAAQSESVVRDAAVAGIRRVWLQQGSVSDAALRYCQENGIEVIANECVLMFAEPVGSFHKVHRWVWKLIGKMPK